MHDPAHRAAHDRRRPRVPRVRVRSTRTSTTGSAVSTPHAASRIRYIPNFVDLDRFRATPKRFDGPRLELLFPRRLCTERGFRDAGRGVRRAAAAPPGASNCIFAVPGPRRTRRSRALSLHGIRIACAGRSSGWTKCRGLRIEPCRARADGIRGGHVAVLHRGDGDEQRDRDHAGRRPAEPRHRRLQRHHRGRRVRRDWSKRSSGWSTIARSSSASRKTRCPSSRRSRASAGAARWSSLLAEYLPGARPSPPRRSQDGRADPYRRVTVAVRITRASAMLR